jgi:hypothetical protein
MGLPLTLFVKKLNVWVSVESEKTINDHFAYLLSREKVEKA